MATIRQQIEQLFSQHGVSIARTQKGYIRSETLGIALSSDLLLEILALGVEVDVTILLTPWYLDGRWPCRKHSPMDRSIRVEFKEKNYPKKQKKH